MRALLATLVVGLVSPVWANNCYVLLNDSSDLGRQEYFTCMEQARQTEQGLRDIMNAERNQIETDRQAVQSNPVNMSDPYSIYQLKQILDQQRAR